MVEIHNIKVSSDDIFRYVVGMSFYDPIEKCIDPDIYEIFDEFVYNNKTKETIQQGEDFVSFSKQVSLLKSKAKEMKYDEIIRLCEELEEISPKYIQL